MCAFSWTWIPAIGHSCGLLLGADEDSFEIGTVSQGRFFVNKEPTRRDNHFKWELFLVYGLANHYGRLHSKIEASPFPVIVGGDLNLM